MASTATGEAAMTDASLLVIVLGALSTTWPLPRAEAQFMATMRNRADRLPIKISVVEVMR